MNCIGAPPNGLLSTKRRLETGQQDAILPHNIHSRLPMTSEHNTAALAFGSEDLRLPDELRGPVRAHLAAIRERYVERG